MWRLCYISQVFGLVISGFGLLVVSCDLCLSSLVCFCLVVLVYCLLCFEFVPFRFLMICFGLCFGFACNVY